MKSCHEVQRAYTYSTTPAMNAWSARIDSGLDEFDALLEDFEKLEFERSTK